MNDYVSGRFAQERHAEFQRDADRDALVALAKRERRFEGVPVRSWLRWSLTALLDIVRLTPRV